MSEAAIEAVQQLIRERDGLQAEVKRLQAAVPDLPDVGPVTRDERGQLLCGDSLASADTSSDELRGYIREALLSAAELGAMVDTLDREAEERAAADIAAPDAADEATVLREKFGRRPGSSSASWEQVVGTLAAHRARTHGEHE